MERDEALLVAIEDAAENDHLELIHELVADGARVSATCDPLIAACESGHIRIIECLVNLGSPVDMHGRFGETPLMAAAGVGCLNAVTFLLAHGADPFKFDTGTEETKNALGWAEMGLAQEKWDDSMPEEQKHEYKQIIHLLSKLETD